MKCLVRIMYALGVLCEDLCIQLGPCADAEGAAPSAAPPRLQQLTDGIPHMIRDERCVTSIYTMQQSSIIIKGSAAWVLRLPS